VPLLVLFGWLLGSEAHLVESFECFGQAVFVGSGVFVHEEFDCVDEAVVLGVVGLDFTSIGWEASVKAQALFTVSVTRAVVDDY
jgi:hypothetical protein